MLATVESEEKRPPQALVLDVATDGSGVSLQLAGVHAARMQPAQHVEFAIQDARFVGLVTRVDQQQSWRKIGLELGDVGQRLELLRVMHMAQA